MNIRLAVIALFLSCSAAFASSGWSEDFPASLARAKAENKLLLVNFTGSDWCPGCIVLEKKFFQTRVFQEYAKDNLVLMKVDFPMKRSQPEQLRQQNRMLERMFKVTGFPTTFVLSPAGKPVYSFMAPNGNVHDLIAQLRQLQPKTSEVATTVEKSMVN